MPYHRKTVTVIIPAYNEEPSIARVVGGVRALRAPEDQSQRLVDDIIVCNNGSTDNTKAEAIRAGAFVCNEFRQGYGFACLRGMQMLTRAERVTPDYVVFVDGDFSVKADELPSLLNTLTSGHDLVVGCRTLDLQQLHALSPHQRFGNYLASALIRLIWKQPVNDLGPFRAIRYERLLQLDMRDKRFGWTVEMQVKAIQARMRYCEVAVTTQNRIGVSKISGTVKGTIGAAFGIFGKVFQLYWQEARFVASLKSLPE